MTEAELIIETRKEVESRVIAMLHKEFGIDPKTVKMDSSFRGALGMESLEAAQLMLELEDLFMLDISDDDIKAMNTVGDVVRYVETHL